MPTTTIASIDALPGGPYNGTRTAGIVITNGIPSFFKITGANLDRIVSVNWYPKVLNSVQFEMRNVILLDNNTGTFMIMVTDNFLYDYNRGGHVSFQLDDRSVLTLPAITYGRVSVGPLWTAPEQGLITG